MRSRVHAAKIGVFVLLAQLFLGLHPSAIPIAVAKADPSIGTTERELPSLGERLGLSERELPEATYRAPDRADEPGELRQDGAFSLPPSYVENPDVTQAPPAKGPYAEHPGNAGKGRDGGVSMLLNVSGDITTSTTWTLANSPYVVSGTINIQSPAVLTIQPGVVVKFDAGASLLAKAGATLTANGTALAPITFTSLKDDSIAGDTNGDGTATTPAAGDWAALGYDGYKDVSGGHAALGSMQFATVRYGQQLQSRFSMPTLQDDAVSTMSLYGLYLDTPPGSTYTIQRLTVTASNYGLYLWAVPSTTTIQNSAVRGTYGPAAVQASSSTAVRLTQNSIDGNGNGAAGFSWAISSASSPIMLRYNSIANNRRADGTTMGLTASGSTVDAQFNWWGSTSGPAVTGQAVTGGGSTISASLVTYTSWLGSAFEAEHKKGNFPWTIKAGTGADVATGNFSLTERDLSIPTVGLPLEVVRTYNNQTALSVNGDFGYGWTWNLGTNLALAPDTYGGVVWEQPDGAKDYFKKNLVDGTYTGEDGVYSRLSYDAGSNTYALTHKDQTQWVFSGTTGKLAKLIDTDGNATVITRDGTGKVQTVTEPTGRALTFTYTGSTISRVTDPLGRTYNYTYSQYSNVGGLTGKEADGVTVFASCSYTYNGQTSMISYTDCAGNSVAQTFDGSRRVATQTINGANTVRFTYGPATDTPTGLVLPQYSTGVWDAYGKANVFYYTKSNKVTEHWREKQIIGGTYYWYFEDLWSYVSYLSTSYRDIDAKTRTSTYDFQAGNLLSTVAPGSRTTSSTYDAFNNRTSATDNLGRVTQFAYDAEQHLTRVTDALTHDTVTTYTAAGLPETVTDARGKVTSFTYDAWGYPATASNAVNETISYHYDAGGRKLWEETPDHKRTTYTYNGRDEVLTATDPLSHTTTTAYDASGRKTQATDAAGRITHYDYQRNALWKTTDAKTGVVTITLNGQGNIASVKDAANHTTSFTYDQFGRQLTQTDPNSKIQATEYTYGGRVSKTTDALGAQTTYTYTMANDLDVVTYPDSGHTLQHTYDGLGNELTMTDWVGTHTSTYDALNRVTSATDGRGDTIAYGYDAVGNLTSLTYPDGRAITYTFDDANRLATVTDWDGRVTTYAYDTAGRIGSFTLPSGVVTTYGYDDASRANHVDHALGATTIAARDYTYDTLGNRLTSVRAAGTESYTYDELYRITGVTYADGAQVGYTYDATGNRLTQTAAGGTTTYSYDGADQLLSAGDGARAYDASGQLTKVGAYRGFTWDARGKLTQVTDSPANSVPTASAGTGQSIYVNQLAILDGRASSDPEGEALGFSWTEDATNPATGLLRGAHASQPGFTPTAAGTYGFHLTVSDGANTSPVAAVTVTVQAGSPPTQTLTSTATGATSGYTWTNGTRQFNADVMSGKNGSAYDGVMQFALPAIPQGTYLSSAALDLTGKSNMGNTATDAWYVDLLPTSLDGTWGTLTWATIDGATADSTLSPVLVGLNKVVANVVNHWDFTSGNLAVLQSRLTGSAKLSVRTRGVVTPVTDLVYWYGGNATNAAQRPKLTLVFTPNPQYDHAALARAGGDQRVAPNAQVTLHGEDSYDYESALASYAWTQTGGAAVTLSAASDPSPTFTPTASGTYRFQLVVTDGASQASTADEVVVTVAAPAPHVTSYAYDGEGDRISQTNDGVTTSYVVNSLPKLGEVLTETTNGQTTTYVYGQDLLYSLTSAGPHYHHTDALGSTIAVTDGAGSVEQTMDYDVFGTLRSSTGASGTTRTFTGEENDTSGLVYLRARFLDPATARFVSRDPYPMKATDTQTVNRYVYVKNNPTNYVDPSGEWSNPFILGIMALSGFNEAYQIKMDAQDIVRHPEFVGPPYSLNDAWRHSRTAKSIAQKIGPTRTYLLGIGNELWDLVIHNDDWHPADALMDLHNNQVGINAAIDGTEIQDRDLIVLGPDRTMDDYNRSLDEARRYREYIRNSGGG
jgi:RHS repeat-associated protein